MPNYITNRLVLGGNPEEIEALKAHMKTNLSDFDFNQIIPKTERVKESLLNEGGIDPYWYKWRIASWGVKWNTCKEEVTVKDNIIEFITARSSIPKLLQYLSEDFFDLTFKYSYADEDTGYNVGKYTISGGLIQEKTIYKGGSKEAYDLCFELIPWSKENYHLVDGEYVWIEEE